MKKVHVRAIKTLLSTYRYYYILVFLKGICTQSIPYVSLLGSAMILEAVTDQQYAQAGKIVMGYLVLLFLLKIGEAYVSPLVDIQRQMGFTDVQQAPYQKMLRLNFHVSDQAETKEALFRIERDMYQTGTSLLAFFEDLATTIPHMVGVVWGVGLFIPIFFYTPTIENGRFFVSPWMVLILLVVSVLGMMGVQALGRHAYQFFVQNFQSQTELRVINNIYYYFYTRLNDSEMGKEIRMYEGAKKIIPHLHAQQAFIAKFLSKYEALNGVQLVFSQIVIRLLTWGIYAIIAINVMTGALALRFLVQLTGVIPLMMHNLTSLFTLQALFVDTETLDYYFGFMDQEEAVRVGSIPVEKRLDHHYPLAVTDLHFSYPGQNREILQGITETFEVGKKYAIVGENGSGKTTFIPDYSYQPKNHPEAKATQGFWMILFFTH